MMIRVTSIIALSCVTLATGCATIHFTKEKASAEATESEWHHDAIFGLVELSPAVDLQRRCKGGLMSSVKTEQTFVQGLVQSVTWSLYNPWNVEYSCR